MEGNLDDLATQAWTSTQRAELERSTNSYWSAAVDGDREAAATPRAGNVRPIADAPKATVVAVEDRTRFSLSEAGEF